jgi:hypothetical protein
VRCRPPGLGFRGLAFRGVEDLGVRPAVYQTAVSVAGRLVRVRVSV